MLRIDWSWTSVVVALCALAATRQLRDGTLQATRRWPYFLGDGWRVRPPFRLLGRWHLVGLPLLLTESVLLEPAADAGIREGDNAHADTSGVTGTNPDGVRGVNSHLPLVVAQAVGFISFVLVAFLLPVAVASHGFVGLIMAVCVLVNFTLLATAALAWAEWRLRAAYGVPDGGFRVRLQSPFSAPYAAATVLERVLGPMGAATTVRRLLPDRGLRDWLRPHVHDQHAADSRHDTPTVIADIVARLSAAEVAAARGRPEWCLDGERYCPRCGSCYEPARDACADCPGAPALA